MTERIAAGLDYIFYGVLDSSGYMYRLENGTTIATPSSTESISAVLRTADFAPHENYITDETFFRGFKLVEISKQTTPNSVMITHFGDGGDTGTSLPYVSPINQGHRLSIHTRMQRIGPHTFHSLQFELGTATETFCFEPLMAVVFYEPPEHTIIRR